MNKFFRKMDEMEMTINLKSLRIAYLFTIIYLLIYLVTVFISSGYDPYAVFKSWAFMLVLSQNIVYMSAQLIIKAKISGGGQNEE